MKRKEISIENEIVKTDELETLISREHKKVKDLKVTSKVSYDAAVQFLVEMKKLKKEVMKKFDPPIKAAKETLKKITEIKAELIKPLDDDILFLSKQTTQYAKKQREKEEVAKQSDILSLPKITVDSLKTNGITYVEHWVIEIDPEWKQKATTADLQVLREFLEIDESAVRKSVIAANMDIGLPFVTAKKDIYQKGTGGRL